jgi:hypothetical protein
VERKLVFVARTCRQSWSVSPSFDQSGKVKKRAEDKPCFFLDFLAALVALWHEKGIINPVLRHICPFCPEVDATSPPSSLFPVMNVFFLDASLLKTG